MGLPIVRRGYRLTKQTIFAIGSCPIDFTHAGILALQDDGRLNLDDSITKFFDHVPEDKQAITLRHLMTGQSGLRDFHDLPTDENATTPGSIVTRPVRRILAQDLLFAPGTSEQHSPLRLGTAGCRDRTGQPNKAIRSSPASDCSNLRE